MVAGRTEELMKSFVAEVIAQAKPGGLTSHEKFLIASLAAKWCEKEIVRGIVSFTESISRNGVAETKKALKEKMHAVKHDIVLRDDVYDVLRKTEDRSFIDALNEIT